MIDKISINTQSSIKIMGDKVVYFDPYKIEENMNDADYVFITHNHYDHYEVESIKKVMNDKTKIVIPDSMAGEVLGILPASNIVGVVPNEYYEIDGLKIETVSSYNTEASFHPKNKEWVGYIILLNDERIYVAGDTNMVDENKNVSCDIALVPIGGTYTMDYKEAAEFINIIKPKYVVPTHYGSIVGDKSDFNKFLDLLDKDIICVNLLDK